MNKFRIGENAGKIWRLLANDNKRWNYYDLKEASELSDRDLNAAIGWLAREDKIDFDKEGDEDCLFLSVNFILAEFFPYSRHHLKLVPGVLFILLPR